MWDVGRNALSSLIKCIAGKCQRIESERSDSSPYRENGLGAYIRVLIKTVPFLRLSDLGSNW